MKGEGLALLNVTAGIASFRRGNIRNSLHVRKLPAFTFNTTGQVDRQTTQNKFLADERKNKID